MLLQFPTTPHRDAQRSLFRSPKCRIPIPVPHILVRHALEQASLDRTVREIQYRRGARIECPPLSLAGIVLLTKAGAFLLRVHNVSYQRNEEDEARIRLVLERHRLQLLERSAEEVLCEPMFSNVRQVWSHAGGRVSLFDRLRLSTALEGGPRRIIELVDRARLDCDIVAAVCALACENLVRIRLHDAPLGPGTIVEV